MAKPKGYYNPNHRMVFIKARRVEQTHAYNRFLRTHFTSEGIPKYLPRKQKKQYTKKLKKCK